MSAECEKHGCDLTYAPDEWPVGSCPQCQLETERDETYARAVSDVVEELRSMRDVSGGWFFADRIVEWAADRKAGT
jgi:hypothetical protein